MLRASNSAPVFAALLLACTLTPACVIDGGERGHSSFERSFDVPARVRIDLTNGSGNTQITAGPAGRVRVHGEVRAHVFLGNARARAEEVADNPPIEQLGSVLRIGARRLHNISISYIIEAPPDAEVQVQSGSGNVQVSGVEGPVRLNTGSGDVEAGSIRRAVEVATGSGDIRVRGVAGSTEASAGSGDVELRDIGGDVRARTGSGDITLHGLGGRADLRTGSGDLEITGAKADVQLKTSSGNCTVEGNPAAGSFWEMETSSGDIELDVPSSASLQLHVLGRSNDVTIELPHEELEKSRRELRARLGQGEARVKVRTSSGSVRLR